MSVDITYRYGYSLPITPASARANGRGKMTAETAIKQAAIDIGALEAVAAMNGGAKVEKAGDQAGPSADTGAYLPAVKAGE